MTAPISPDYLVVINVLLVNLVFYWMLPLKEHSHLWDCAQLDTSFLTVKKVHLNPKSNYIWTSTSIFAVFCWFSIIYWKTYSIFGQTMSVDRLLFPALPGYALLPMRLTPSSDVFQRSWFAAWGWQEVIALHVEACWFLGVPWTQVLSI